jgi:uncharacterized protein DUF3800
MLGGRVSRDRPSCPRPIRRPTLGKKSVRIAFLDEGGISQHENFVVVAGAIVHGDEQLIPLETKLEDLVRKHIPEKDRDGFVFHAAHIWSGAKYFKDREVWPWERRAAILDDLVAIPGELEIPIVYSWLEKEKVRATVESHLNSKSGMARPHDCEIGYHAITFANCIIRIEQMMRSIWALEVAQVIAEDNSDARQAIKGTVQLLKDPARIAAAGIESQLLPLERIRNSVQFAEKPESKPLQLADVCACLIRRRYSNHDARSARFYNKLKPWMLTHPRSDTTPAVSAKFSRTWRASAAQAGDSSLGTHPSTSSCGK